MRKKYFYSVVDTLSAMEKLLKQGFEILADYKIRKSDTPFAILHYPDVVKNVVGKYSLGTVGDPMKNGTDYYGFYDNMIQNFEKLVGDVIRNAPDSAR